MKVIQKVFWLPWYLIVSFLDIWRHIDVSLVGDQFCNGRRVEKVSFTVEIYPQLNHTFFISTYFLSRTPLLASKDQLYQSKIVFKCSKTLITDATISVRKKTKTKKHQWVTSQKNFQEMQNKGQGFITSQESYQAAKQNSKCLCPQSDSKLIWNNFRKAMLLSGIPKRSRSYNSSTLSNGGDKNHSVSRVFFSFIRSLTKQKQFFYAGSTFFAWS